MNDYSPSQRFAAEAIGTAFLLAAVVGSGIMGERLAGGSVGLALLANSIATGAALFALILSFGPISGAHLNPLVSLAAYADGMLSRSEAAAYVAAQAVGAVAGVWLAHAMFGLDLIQTSAHVRTGPGQWLGEFVATFGLIAVIEGCRAAGRPAVAGAVATYITAAYWFTSSTSFANPAVTLARAASDTFAGIDPASVPGFLIAQIAGAVAARGVFVWLRGRPKGSCLSPRQQPHP
jgi:glycerol uptake facilitator-like aquaporin